MFFICSHLGDALVNSLYFGDNLKVLREHVADESVDLVYLDPPFNSNATYNVLFKAPDGQQSQSQIEAFDDTWHWTDAAEDAYWQVLRGPSSDAAKMLEAMCAILGKNDMMAYLAMMAIRLIELHRVLKPTGSLYLHCDPTASHYLKILLDSIFGGPNFRTEISWRRQSAHNDAAQGRSQYGNVRDIILFYTKSSKWSWNWLYTPYDPAYVKDFYRHVEAGTGRRYRLGDITAPGGASPQKRNPHYEFLGVTRFWRYSQERMAELYAEGRIVQTAPGRVPQYKRYLDEMPGVALQNDWTDILPLHGSSEERLGYPTQKPVALLERIISASSNPGDVVLDPFCGCGTTVHAAQKLGRQWIGIDITPLAVNLIKRRLGEAFGKEAQFRVHGLPQDLDGARALFEQDPHAFQLWAVSLIPDAQPWKGGRKGADTGIDGQVYFRTEKAESHRGMISVKGGKNVGVAMVRDFAHVVDREKAAMGFFLTLTPPTRDMDTEAVKAGYFETDRGRYRKIQILTIEQMLSGHRPEMPFIDSSAFKRAKREVKPSGEQGSLDL